MSLKTMPPKRSVSPTLLAVSENKKKDVEKAPSTQRVDEDIDIDDIEDKAPEGLKLLTVGALVQYTNREKIKSKRSISKALEKVDSGTIKIGTDLPKYIADQLSYMSKQAGLSQKDYILKLTLEDMYKRGVFEEPKADS
jgi:hypothetical protein